MRLVLAARLSQLAKGQTGLDTQDEDARAWADAHGHIIIAACTDRISGRVPPANRRNLGPWLTDPARIATYDGILVSKIDRLTRKRDWDIRQWAEDNGKKIIVVQPELIWPPEKGDTATSIIWDNLVNLAASEWENTSLRYQRMHRALRDQAFFVGKRPYGYRIVQVKGTEHKTLEIDPVTGPIAQAMAKRYLDGESLQQICEWLISERIPVPQQPKDRPGRGWTSQAVRHTLRNPAMIGRIQVKGKTYLRVKPLILADDYRKILALMASRPTFRGKREATTALLTGMIFCPEDHPMYRLKTPPVSTVPDGLYYYCRQCPKGHRLLVSLTYIDAAISGEIMAYGDERDKVIETIPPYDYADEISHVKQDFQELDLESTPNIEAETTRLHAELAKWLALREEAKSKPLEVVKRDSNRTVGEEWAGRHTAGKRKFLQEKGLKVIVYSNGVSEGSKVIDGVGYSIGWSNWWADQQQAS